MSAIDVPEINLPPGTIVELPGRGDLLVRDIPGPRPDSPVLLLQHGWSATADLNWFACYDTLSSRYRVISMPLRGHGGGIRSSDLFTIEDCADDSAALIDALGLETVNCVGYSMGGTVAQSFWHRHPERVTGLVLCATSRSFADTQLERVGYALFPGAAFIARSATDRAKDQLYQRALRVRQRATGLPDEVFDEIGKNDPRMVLEAGAALGRFSSIEWIGELNVPAAVLITTRDTVVPPSRQEKLAEAIEHGLTLRVAGDHGVVARDPERFVPSLMAACKHVTSPVNAID